MKSQNLFVLLLTGLIKMPLNDSNQVSCGTQSFAKRFTLKSLLDQGTEPFDVVFICKHTIHQPGIREIFSCKVKIIYDGVPFACSKVLNTTQVIEVRFDIGVREEFYINDFMIPEDLRCIGVGSFVLKTIYDLVPQSIKSGQLVIAGNLTNGKDNTPARNSLWMKTVGCDNVHFDDNNFGKFKGRFLDPGDNWKNKLIVTECITETDLD